MVVKGTCLYLLKRYCGKCGEPRYVAEGVNNCPEPDCNQRLRTRPRLGKHKDKYNLSGRY